MTDLLNVFSAWMIRRRAPEVYDFTRPLASRDPLASIRSYTVFVCPGFECNSVMERRFDRLTFVCVNGHEWTDEQIERGHTARPWRTWSCGSRQRRATVLT